MILNWWMGVKYVAGGQCEYIYLLVQFYSRKKKKKLKLLLGKFYFFLAHMKAQNVDMDRAVKLVVQELTVTPFVFVLIYTLIYYNY